MHLADLLSFLSSRDPLVERMAREIAGKCRITVLRQVSRDVGGMSQAQAKGYIRAHAAAQIRAETDAALNWYGVGPALRTPVTAEATEVLIAAVLRDLGTLTPHRRQVLKAAAA